METATTAQYKLAEIFLDSCTRFELEATAEMMGLSVWETRETLTHVAKPKAMLIADLLEAERLVLAKRYNNPLFQLSPDYGDLYYANKTMTEIKCFARHRDVPLTRKTWAVRTVKKHENKIKNQLLYDTNYADFF